MGNLRSVARAFQTLNTEVKVVETPAEIAEFSPDMLVLPGVGALRDCMAGLKASGLDQFISDWISKDQPFLGICLGLQALFDFSEEGNVDGLGILQGKVRRFTASSELRVPHMGWNTVAFRGESPIGEALPHELACFYFDHSYYVDPVDPQIIAGTTDYGISFCSCIRKGNCFATQFHPEKSQALGLSLLRHFLIINQPNHAVSPENS